MTDHVRPGQLYRPYNDPGGNLPRIRVVAIEGEWARVENEDGQGPRRLPLTFLGVDWERDKTPYELAADAPEEGK